MARYKPIDTSARFIAVDLTSQLVPGTFEHALDHLLDHEIDLSDLDARDANDATGAPAYPTAVLFKVILFDTELRGLLLAVRTRFSRPQLRHRGQRVGIAGQEPAAVGLFAVYRDSMTGELRRFSAGARGHG